MRTEVTMALDQRVTHGEVLGHTRHGVVNGHIAMRVVFAHDVADYTRRFLEWLVGPHTHDGHAIDDPSLNWLHAILGIGQSPRSYGRHGIVEERGLYLLIEVGRLKTALDAFLDPAKTGSLGFLGIIGRDFVGILFGLVDVIYVRVFVFFIVIVCHQFFLLSIEWRSFIYRGS